MQKVSPPVGIQTGPNSAGSPIPPSRRQKLSLYPAAPFFFFASHMALCFLLRFSRAFSWWKYCERAVIRISVSLRKGAIFFSRVRCHDRGRREVARGSGACEPKIRPENEIRGLGKKEKRKEEENVAEGWDPFAPEPVFAR